MEDINEIAQNVESKEDFIQFIGMLIKDLAHNPNEWENKNLNDYLDAILSWTEDMDGYYINHNIPIPKNVNWKVFSNMLIAAKIYE